MQPDHKPDQNETNATQTQRPAFIDIRPFEDCVLHALVAALAEVTNYFPDAVIDELKRRATDYENKVEQKRKFVAALNAETRLNFLILHYFKYPQLARIRIIHLSGRLFCTGRFERIDPDGPFRTGNPIVVKNELPQQWPVRYPIVGSVA